MNKLKNSCLVTEIDTVSDKLVMLYKEAPQLANDKILKPVFEEMEDLSLRITEAINRDKARSLLKELDDGRNASYRNLGSVISGYAAMLNKDLANSGAALKKIFDKFGLKVTTQSYDVKSSYIESLLMDLSSERAKFHINKLPGLNDNIEELRTLEKEFKHATVDFDEIRRDMKASDSATRLKKELLFCINTKMVSYLNSASVVDDAEFGKFATAASNVIERVNTAIDVRKARRENGEEEPESEEEVVSE